MNGVRLKRLARSVREPATEGDYIGLEHVESETGRLLAVNSETEPAGAITFRSGDVLYGKLRPYLRKVFAAPFDGRCSSEFLVLRALGADPRFLSYLLLSSPVTEWCVTNSDGAKMPRTEWDVVGQASVLVPDVARQRTIVHYLDRETARIDALIEGKRRLTDLLAQRRTETIRTLSRAGVEPVATVLAPPPWIGRVPSHWDILPLRRVGRLLAGAPFPEEFQGQVDAEIPYFKVADFESAANTEYMTTASNTVSRSTAATLGSPVIPAGSVVFPKIGAALLSNRRRITRTEACLDQNVMALVLRQGTARFYFYLLQTFDFGRLRMPGPIPLFNERDAASLLVPVPPLEEQEAICRRIDREVQPLDVVIRKEVSGIRLLRERRQALITAAVAGQIEIPGAA